MKTYAVKEMFLTLQGEGAQVGRVAVFLRFAGCNLWSGREEDRGRGDAACSSWCDTDFRGGKRMTGAEVAARAVELWGVRSPDRRLLVLTGGEPLLQVDAELAWTLRQTGFRLHLETNGSLPLPRLGLEVTVSPKPGPELKVKEAAVLKLVWPQPGVDPAMYEGREFNWGQMFLQPLDGPDREANTRACVQYVLEHPRWRLSLQTHKFLGIP